MLPVALLGIAVLGIALSAPASNAASTDPVPGTVLTLNHALARALKDNPSLSSFSEEIRAREAEALQAGLGPNPLFSLESENIAGNGDFSGTAAAETTFSVRQVLELGGKRHHRKALAESDVALALHDYEMARSDVLASTAKRFLAVLAAQERLRMAEDLLDLGHRSLETVEDRIAAGKSAATERLKARILVAELKSGREKARHSLEGARQGLAAQLGMDREDFLSVAGSLKGFPPLPDLEELRSALEHSPALLRRIAEVERRRRAVSLEQSRRIPDLEVGLGIRRFNETDDTALVLGFSVPLPLFDRNQGGRAAAGSRLTQARVEERGAALEARGTLASAWQEMKSARSEAEILDTEIIPTAQQNLDAAEYGYKAGKYGISEVLEAHRLLVEARARRLDTVIALHSAAVELDRLLGRGFSDMQRSSTFKE